VLYVIHVLLLILKYVSSSTISFSFFSVVFWRLFCVIVFRSFIVVVNGRLFGSVEVAVIIVLFSWVSSFFRRFWISVESVFRISG